MKKRRRIEITTYRRRTTFVVRDKAESERVVAPSLSVDASLPALAKSPVVNGNYLRPSGQAASAGLLESPEVRREIEKQLGGCRKTGAATDSAYLKRHNKT